MDSYIPQRVKTLSIFKHSRNLFQHPSKKNNFLQTTPHPSKKKKTNQVFLRKFINFTPVNFNHSTRPQGWKNRRGRELLVDRKRRVSRVRATPPSSAAGRINFVPWRDNSRPRVDALTRVKISPRSTPLAETRASSRRDAPFVVVLVPEKKKTRRLVKEKKEHFSIWYVFFF